ncbi:MAG: arsenate reductase ArsC [Telluria sp.]
MDKKPYHILFLCTGNSARSIMAEALVTQLGEGRFLGFSAGSQPTGKPNPFAVEKVAALGYPHERLRSKSWNEFAGPDAPPMDFIITVCANAAGEACPMWPGHPATAHWDFDDPAAATGTDEDKRAEFTRVFEQIQRRVAKFIALPVETMSDADIRAALRRIGEEPA